MNPVFRNMNLDNPATFTSQKVTVSKKPGTLTSVILQNTKNRVICNN